MVYRLVCGNTTLILKFFRPAKTFLLNGYNLKPLLKRDRLRVSTRTYNKLKTYKRIVEYLPPDLWTFPGYGLIITSERNGDFINLSKLLKACNSITILPKIHKLTRDWLSVESSNHEPPKEFNNRSVWVLKRDLQIIKPLSFIFRENEIINFIRQLGPMKYFSHGDLQPKNILVTGNELEIVDFEEGFFAPLAWDVGFLWGNLLYLTAYYEKEFVKYYQTWLLLRSRMKSSTRRNFTIITIAIFLMRMWMFPLEKLSKRKEIILRKKVIKMKELLF